MDARNEGNRRTIIGAGLSPDMAGKLSAACDAMDSAERPGFAADVEELFDLLADGSDARDVTVVLAGRWLKEEGLELLTGVREQANRAVTVAIGSDLGSLALGHALRLGLRGLADPDVDVTQLAQLLRAVAAGDIWISRRQLVEAVQFLAPDDDHSQSGAWLNLPMLTERERMILMELLEGKPNKQIARQLDISEQTVKIHVMHVYRKLGVRRRAELLKALGTPSATTSGLSDAVG